MAWPLSHIMRRVGLSDGLWGFGCRFLAARLCWVPTPADEVK